MRAPLLKPCPACGGQAEMAGAVGSEVWAYCPACGLRTDEERAGAAWAD